MELFSMGIGTYTEEDVKSCAKAFTGWTIQNADYMSIRASRDSIWPHGRLDWQFVYDPEDHDDTTKIFLGQTGRFNGEDVIDIICAQPACAWFVASKLYDFFVSDTPDEAAIQTLADEFQRSHGNIESVLRTMFLSGFFRSEQVRFARVKSPAEMVAGTARLAGSHRTTDWSIVGLAMDANFMGQEILNPPSVEGWHTGTEWIDTGSLVERINSAAQEVGNTGLAGVKEIIRRMRDGQDVLSPQDFVDRCLDLAGGVKVTEATNRHLTGYAASQGDLRFDRDELVACSEQRVADMLQLIVATREYQLA